jgi:hypothetical protein
MSARTTPAAMSATAAPTAARRRWSEKIDPMVHGGTAAPLGQELKGPTPVAGGQSPGWDPAAAGISRSARYRSNSRMKESSVRR